MAYSINEDIEMIDVNTVGSCVDVREENVVWAVWERYEKRVGTRVGATRQSWLDIDRPSLTTATPVP
jgi:hypothetical protein